MTPDPDDELQAELVITFVPKAAALASRGITEDEFEEALIDALEDREALAAAEDAEGGELPPLEEMPLSILGVTYKLEELAEVVIQESDA